ncbi:MAG TPA: class I SAM-dependent methyltransferase [Streptosporangiaceae bacterium]|jgi:SAM-dependent methyltransferase
MITANGLLGTAAPARDQRRSEFPDWRFAPNIAGRPDVYQLENEALDRAGHVLDALRTLAPWAGKTIVDLGCGTGYWLARYAGEAARVIGIEPDDLVRASANHAIRDLAGPASAGPGPAHQQPDGRRLAGPGLARPGLAATGPGRVMPEVLAGSAEHTGLPDACADVVHARFAYFFPPGKDAGLAEVLRILRPGGRLLVVDNDYRWGEFAGLLAAASSKPPREVAATVDQWWHERGARRHEVRSELRFRSRAELAAVLHIELPAAVADDWLARRPLATGMTYGYVLFDVTRTGAEPLAGRPRP